MSKIKKLIASPACTIGALALAVVLLAFSAIGGTRAALTYYSENYVSTVQMQELGVTLMENGVPVATGNAAVSQTAALLEQGKMMLNGQYEPAGEPFKLGATYQEVLTVHNPTDNGDAAANGAYNITQYVRVTVLRYWIKPVGTGENAQYIKSPELKPELIDLHFVTDKGWVIDEQASTPERTVLYYTRPLAPGAVSPEFADTLRIDPSVQVIVEQQDDGKTITNTYVYDNAAFQLEVKVDAVQNHNAADAIRSAWGREVTIGADGTLSLN